MKRLFGSKKAAGIPERLAAASAAAEAKSCGTASRLQALEAEIAMLISQYRFARPSEKAVLKAKLGVKLAQKNQLEALATRQTSALLALHQAQINSESAQGIEELAKVLESAKPAFEVKNSSVSDDLIDRMEDFDEILESNCALETQTRQQIDPDFDLEDSLDNRIEKIGNELFLHAELQKNADRVQKKGYDPLRD